jgi:hypothetical protein
VGLAVLGRVGREVLTTTGLSHQHTDLCHERDGLLIATIVFRLDRALDLYPVDGDRVLELLMDIVEVPLELAFPCPSTGAVRGEDSVQFSTGSCDSAIV